MADAAVKLVFGCGYLGSRVARIWREAGADVWVVTRSSERAGQLTEIGYHAVVADVTRPATLVKLPAAETVLYSVGFDRTAGQQIEDVYVGGLSNALAALPANTGRVVYISTTGVYGSSAAPDTDWVDEQTPPDPQRAGGRASLAAEQLLASQRWGESGIVLRLAGIYGPDRMPFLDRLRSGVAIPVQPHGYLNLIHVADAARIVDAAANYRSPTAGTHCFCVSDGQPVPRGEFYREVARQLGAPAPTFVPPDSDSRRAARAATSKRISPARMMRELRVHLNYPSYQEGLQAILGESTEVAE